MVLASLGSAPELACPQVIGTRPLNEHELDADVVATMSSLLCFSDRAKLLAELSCDRHNTEKVVYFLLLDRKLRRPCHDDPDEFRRKTPRICKFYTFALLNTSFVSRVTVIFKVKSKAFQLANSSKLKPKKQGRNYPTF